MSIAWGLYDTGVLTWRNLLRILRNPAYLITEVVVQPILFTLLFAYVFGGAIHVPGASYIDFLMPGIFVQTITFGSLNTAVALGEDLQKGLMDRFRSLPIAFWAVPVSRVLADLLIDVVGLGLMVGVAYLIGFRFHGGAAAAGTVALLLLLYGLAMACLGALLGMALRTVTMIQAAGFLVIFPLTFASSTFVPVNTMPVWLQAVAAHTPVTAIVDVARHLTLGAAASGSNLATALAWVVGTLVVTIPGATYLFRKFGR
ncbi:MAG TPA: ABC transporter permease [Candidatus Dormibacteraeota bacterium]|nr:ABC transporter permease [Candidatus Dormibacteraeota bacterium]